MLLPICCCLVVGLSRTCVRERVKPRRGRRRQHVARPTANFIISTSPHITLPLTASSNQQRCLSPISQSRRMDRSVFFRDLSEARFVRPLAAIGTVIVAIQAKSSCWPVPSSLRSFVAEASGALAPPPPRPSLVLALRFLFCRQGSLRHTNWKFLPLAGPGHFSPTTKATECAFCVHFGANSWALR